MSKQRFEDEGRHIRLAGKLKGWGCSAALGAKSDDVTKQQTRRFKRNVSLVEPEVYLCSGEHFRITYAVICLHQEYEASSVRK